MPQAGHAVAVEALGEEDLGTDVSDGNAALINPQDMHCGKVGA